MNDIRKKHQAPKGWFGHALLIILGLFLLWQPWYPEVKLWAVLLILLPLVLMIISHLKQRRRKKKLELGEKSSA